MTTTESLKQLLALSAKATPDWKPDYIENSDAVVDYVQACSPDVIAELVTELLVAREGEMGTMLASGSSDLVRVKDCSECGYANRLQRHCANCDRALW